MMRLIPSNGRALSRQHSIKFPLLIVSLSTALLLSACGGGGGGGTSPLAEPPADTNTIDTNTAPLVENVSTTVVKNTPKTVMLPGVDAQGDSLTYSVVSAPAHGTVIVSGNVATYTPTNNYTGADSFIYKANDGKADSVAGTVSITVAAVNHAPTASAVNTSTDEDTVKVITLAGSDADGDSLLYTKVSDPTHGTVSISGNVATYTPAPNSHSGDNIFDLTDYEGSDSFTYKVSDGTAESAVATVSVTVNSVNDAPVADPFAETADAGVAKSFDLRGMDVDDLVIRRTASITAQPQKGTLTLNGLRVTYTPAITASGMDTFKYTLSDGKATSNEALVTVLITGSPVVQPSPTGKLNDTGITQCGDGASTNGLTCPQAGLPGQDAETGRDATQATNNDADGHRGFSFTKISSTGVALPASATEWSCVKDNVTGLIWEVKTDDGGLHDKDWTYTWYEPDSSKNGGNAGTANGGVCGVTSTCDTSSYVQAVKTAGGWCGANDWRMPTVDELSGIARLDRYQYPATDAPAIDTSYFPNTTSTVAEYGEYAVFWSASPGANDGDSAWDVFFSNGSDGWYFKDDAFQVRLVRSGQ